MDLTSVEFKNIYLGYSGKTFGSNNTHVNTGANADSVDWEKKGKVSAVKD